MVQQTEQNMKGMSKNSQMKIIKKKKHVLKTLFEKMNIGHWDRDLTYEELSNPYCNEACMIMQLYSMELGSPPLYAEVNRVCRDMDTSLLKELGPFVKALGEICSWGESAKGADDKVNKNSRDAAGVGFNMSASFLVWRGA